MEEGVRNSDINVILFIPWFCCKDVLLLSLIISIYFINTVDIFNTVRHFPSFQCIFGIHCDGLQYKQGTSLLRNWYLCIVNLMCLFSALKRKVYQVISSAFDHVISMVDNCYRCSVPTKHLFIDKNITSFSFDMMTIKHNA